MPAYSTNEVNNSYLPPEASEFVCLRSDGYLNLSPEGFSLRHAIQMIEKFKNSSKSKLDGYLKDYETYLNNLSDDLGTQFFSINGHDLSFFNKKQEITDLEEKINSNNDRIQEILKNMTTIQDKLDEVEKRLIKLEKQYRNKIYELKKKKANLITERDKLLKTDDNTFNINSTRDQLNLYTADISSVEATIRRLDESATNTYNNIKSNQWWFSKTKK